MRNTYRGLTKSWKTFCYLKAHIIFIEFLFLALTVTLDPTDPSPIRYPYLTYRLALPWKWPQILPWKITDHFFSCNESWKMTNLKYLNNIYWIDIILSFNNLLFSVNVGLLEATNTTASTLFTTLGLSSTIFAGKEKFSSFYNCFPEKNDFAENISALIYSFTFSLFTQIEIYRLIYELI